MVRISVATICDLAWATVELAYARLRLSSLDLSTLVAKGQGPLEQLGAAEGALVERVAYAIPRVAARLPWRAACLVQAVAASRWLSRAGVANSIVIGVRRNSEENIDGHAWLMAGTQVVIGGDVSPYQRLDRYMT